MSAALAALLLTVASLRVDPAMAEVLLHIAIGLGVADALTDSAHGTGEYAAD